MPSVAIHDFLPHRDPMLMVDYIDDIGDDHVVCSFRITVDNLFCQDGLLQESGLIENMAQTCSSIVGQTYYSSDYNPEIDSRIVGFISGIKSLRIYQLPEVHKELVTTAELSSKFKGEGYSICTMNVQSKVSDVLCAEAEINLFLQERRS